MSTFSSLSSFIILYTLEDVKSFLKETRVIKVQAERNNFDNWLRCSELTIALIVKSVIFKCERLSSLRKVTV
jgi:hypothetical protein